MDTTSGDFQNEQQIESDQTAFSPDFDGREVNGTQNVPVGFEKSLPGALPLSLRCRLDAVGFQDVSDGLIGDVVAQVR